MAVYSSTGSIPGARRSERSGVRRGGSGEPSRRSVWMIAASARRSWTRFRTRVRLRCPHRIVGDAMFSALCVVDGTAVTRRYCRWRRRCPHGLDGLDGWNAVHSRESVARSLQTLAEPTQEATGVGKSGGPPSLDDGARRPQRADEPAPAACAARAAEDLPAEARQRRPRRRARTGLPLRRRSFAGGLAVARLRMATAHRTKRAAISPPSPA